MRTLHLILKKRWFDMIDAGIKLEEYREPSLYWLKRLMGPNDNLIQWDAITFQHGYSRNARRFTIQCLGVKMKTGRHEWGAEPGKVYITF
jgi:hypothetical protein